MVFKKVLVVFKRFGEVLMVLGSGGSQTLEFTLPQTWAKTLVSRNFGRHNEPIQIFDWTVVSGKPDTEICVLVNKTFRM